MIIISLTYPDLTRSPFPNEVMKLRKIRDPLLSEMPILSEYQINYSQGNYTKCNEILEQNPTLIECIVNADLMLTLFHNIIAVQRTFDDNFKQYIIELTKDRGQWSGAIAYNKYNVVYYAPSGTLIPYWAIKEVPAGTLPTNMNYFYPLAIKGDTGAKGADGLNLTFQGAYNQSKPYIVNDCVQFNGSMYACIVANTGSLPPIGTPENTYWSLTFAFSIQDGYITFDMLSTALKQIITDSSIIIDDTTGVRYKWGSNNGLVYMEEL